MSLDLGDDKAWRVLASPYRMRLFELIRRDGPCTITELAELAKTNPVNLYYHMHALKHAGLIVPSGRRPGVARRAPVIYKAPFSELIIEFDPSNTVHQERLESIRRSWQREAHEAVEQSGRRHDRGQTGQFTTHWRWECLRPEELQKISEHIDQINEILNRSNAAPPTEGEDASLVYIGMHIADGLKKGLPAPRISTRVRARQIPISEPKPFV